MKPVCLLIAVSALLVTLGFAQTPEAGSNTDPANVKGCLGGSDGNYTVMEDGCTLGAGALVHYGVTMGQGSQLRPDSFLMKGESVPAHARWGGQ